MSVLSWGKPKIYFATSTGTRPANGSGWTLLDTPVEGTTTLDTTEGTKTEAKEEGGAIIDTRVQKSTFALSFELYIKKPASGVTPTLPFTDDDGIITDNVAISLVAEDPDCVGLRMDYCSVTALKTYSAADGIRVKYTCTALKPTASTGNETAQMMKLMVQTDPTVS